MEKISKGFAGRTIRAVLFIVLVVIFCTAVSSAGIFLASRFGLTKSREQVPLTALSIGMEGKAELPGRGKMVEGDGWKLRNSRDIYTLTLDNAIIEGERKEVAEAPQPAITVTGDLILELKEGSGSWIRSEGAGIWIQSGTLTVRGNGSLSIESGDTGILGQSGSQGQTAVRLEGGALDIKGKYQGICCQEAELAGSQGSISAGDEAGVGIYAASVKVEAGKSEIRASGKGAALIAAGAGQAEPSIETDKKTAVLPDNVRVAELEAAMYHAGRSTEEERSGQAAAILTYSSEEKVTYNDHTACFDGAAKELTFIGE